MRFSFASVGILVIRAWHARNLRKLLWVTLAAIDWAQEPITQSLHLPYKPLESTLSDENLFIEIVFAENLSRPNA